MNFKRFGRTANLFDGIIESGYYNDNGILVADQTTSHSTSYIPVTTTTYTISGLWYQAGLMANFAVYEWDSNKNWLRRSNRQYPPETNVITFTIGSDAAYITLQIQTSHGDIMLNAGSTALPYQPYKDWADTPHYIHKTSTDTLTTLPVVLYPTGTTATVGLKGNMEQSGTSTPDSPIMPQGTGERTGNLFDKSTAIIGERVLQNSVTADVAAAHSDYIDVTGISTLTVNKKYNATNFYFYADKTNTSIGYVNGFTANVPAGAKYCRINVVKDDVDTIMLNLGSTPLPFEPHGYKLDISSASTTTPVYLGEVESTRKIKKYEFTGQEEWSISNNERVLYVALADHITSNELICYCSHYQSIANISAMPVLSNGECAFNNTLRWFYIKDDNYNDATSFKTYLQQQYAAGTPVTVWYVLAEPTTGIVNEPLRKIGDYADEVSGITIPTIAGVDSFDVLTTLKPSEVSLNYTGWHDAQCKEYDGSQWA